MKAAECISYMLESSVKFNRTKILKDENNSKVLYDQHVQIYDAVRSKNVQEAIEIMNKHLSFVRKIT